MKKNVLIGLGAFILILGGLWWFWPHQKISTGLNNPLAKKEIIPSETSIEYTDPTGFSFLYPDNLSVTNNLTSENPDPNAYADLQIFSKDKSGSLSLRITDTKLATISAWLKENNISDSNTPIEKKLGNLNALEVKTSDRLLLGALDQGILFTIELPLIEQPFWNEVYNKVLADFSFISPETASAGNITQSSGDEVIFEGEEVVE